MYHLKGLEKQSVMVVHACSSQSLEKLSQNYYKFKVRLDWTT